MTLIELLAAISLFAVLIALSSTLMIQLMKSEEQTSGDISLSQNTNVLINEIRSQYIDESEKAGSDIIETDICFQEFDGLTIDQVIINGNDDKKKETLEIEDSCIKDMKKQKVLPIKITTTNDAGQDFTVETTWENDDEYVLKIKNKDGDNEEYEFTEDGKFAGCKYDKNTRFKNPYNNQKVMFKNNKCTDNTFVVNGSAWFDGDIEIKHKVRLNITKNLYIQDKLSVVVGKGGNKDAVSICVEGEIYFPDGKSEEDYDIDFKCH